MRILHMIDLLTTGGAQKLLVTFGHEAKRCGVDTDIVCLNSEANSTVGRELQTMGLPVTYFPAPHLMDIPRMWKVGRYLRRNRPDVMQTHLLYANVVGGLTGAAAGIPVIATLHTTGPEAWHSALRSWMEAQVLKRLDRRIVAIGYKTAEAHQPRVGRKKIDVIPNAVRLPVQLTASERAAVRRDLMRQAAAKWLLISVGDFAPRKAFDDLLRAFARLKPRCPQAVLALAGDGELRAELEALSRSLGLEDSVHFLGNRTDVPRLLAASDMFLCSSVAEGMPLAVMEAMMAGLPIVSTSAGDLEYMLQPDRGIIVPLRQPEQLGQAAAALLEDEARMRALGQRARDYAMQNYDSSAWIKKLLALYQQVMH